MISTTFDSIWRDISPFAVGFDRTFDTLELLANSKAKEANYPPYNIRKLSDDQYTIELAIAGFNEKDIEYQEVFSKDGSILSKLVCLIYQLDLTSIYHAGMSGIDPSPVNSIDFVKKRL